MSYHYTFKPAGPQEVIVTGTFDNWSKTLPLVKQTDGSFSLTAPLPPTSEEINYKYVVDGDWKTNPEELTTTDASGIENNTIPKNELKELVVVPGSIIPESGLPVENKSVSNDNELKTTVLPKEEPHHASVAGEPGVFIPKDKEALSAFEKVEDVDPKTLNENVTEVGTANTEVPNESITAPSTGVLVEGSDLTPEEKKKQKKKIKRTQYKAKKKKKDAAAAAANGGSVETSTEEGTPEPEENDVSKTAAVAGVGAVSGAAAAAAAATAALQHHPETLGSTTHPTDDAVTKDIKVPVHTDVKEPVATEPTVAEPVVAEPVAAEPVVAEPVVAEPVVSEPVVEQAKESIPTEPVVAEEVPAVAAVDGTAPVVTAEDLHPKTLDPKAVEGEAQEVDASPVAATGAAAAT
ncbi:hypothetical protein G210_5009, partial [Candida maltosa Xu316]